MAHIVVEDDDAHIRELIGVYLRYEGFEVTEADDGREALTAVNTAQADLVILDIERMNAGEIPSKLKGKMDLDHISAFGHSFGGAASYDATYDPRILPDQSQLHRECLYARFF